MDPAYPCQSLNARNVAGRGGGGRSQARVAAMATTIARLDAAVSAIQARDADAKGRDPMLRSLRAHTGWAASSDDRWRPIACTQDVNDAIDQLNRNVSSIASTMERFSLRLEEALGSA